MSICEAPVVALIQIGHIAITPRSIPPLFFVFAYILVFGAMTLKNGLWRWRDGLVMAVIVGVQTLLLKTGAVPGGNGLSGVGLLGGFAAFLIGYGCWRIGGKRPLMNWPWYRFGLLVTLSVLLTDIAVAALNEPPPGSIWQLGGACYTDALLVGPPVITLLYAVFLVCVTPWTFCSKECIKLGRCRYGCGGSKAG